MSASKRIAMYKLAIERVISQFPESREVIEQAMRDSRPVSFGF